MHKHYMVLDKTRELTSMEVKRTAIQVQISGSVLIQNILLSEPMTTQLLVLELSSPMMYPYGGKKKNHFYFTLFPEQKGTIPK